MSPKRRGRSSRLLDSPARVENKPIGAVLWAFVDDEVGKRLAEGTTKLRPQDWSSGKQLSVVEVISPRTD